MRVIYTLLFILLHIPHLQAQQKTENDLLKRGIKAWEQRNYQASVILFTQALEEDELLFDAYRYRGSAMEQLGKPEEASRDYFTYLIRFPEEVEVLLPYSILNYQLKNYAVARDGFKKLLLLPPGETNTIFFRQPIYQEGVTSIFTAQSQDRSFLYNYLGLSEFGTGNISGGVAYLDTAIQMNPSKADYYISRGLLYQETNRTSLARADYEKALALEPENDLARYNLAVLTEQTDDPQVAEAHFTEAINNNPNAPYAYRHRGHRRMLSGEYSGALSDFNKALQLEATDVETLINRGILYERMKNYDLAISDYSKAIELQPNSPKAYLNRGNVLYKLHEYEDALNDYNVALIYDEDYGLAYYQRGITYFRLQQHDKACEDIQKAAAGGIKEAKKATLKVCL